MPFPLQRAFRVTLSLVFIATTATAVASSIPSAFLQNLLSVYESRVSSVFPVTALNSTVALNSFLLDLPPLANVASSIGDNNDSAVTLESACSASSSSVDECLAALPADHRSQIIAVGDFLSQHGQLKSLDKDCVGSVAPVLLKESSKHGSSNPAEAKPKVSLATSAGYGVLFVTIISCCSLGGALIMPFIDTGCYKKCLMWMVGLAVGTLSGSGLLHLMPHAFGMGPEKLGLGYLYRASTIFFGIYLFFIVERILRWAESWRKKRRDTRRRMRHISHSSQKGGEGEAPEVDGRNSPEVPICSMHAQFIPTNEGIADMKVPHHHHHNNKPRTPRHSESHQTLKSPEDQTSRSEVGSDDVVVDIKTNGSFPNGGVSHEHSDHHGHHGHSHDLPAASGGTSDIATVAWMVIFGDGLHNFIDGLSIGAAFSESILSGISVSVAVICEEFPHELGDFAILLNSGMKFKQALMYNFMSACMCYVGLIFGIILGDTTESAQWIFALAAGMFLYISLVNMVPELNQQAEEMSKSGTPTWLVLILQHSGIIIGFTIMYLMAAYGENINFGD